MVSYRTLKKIRQNKGESGGETLDRVVKKSLLRKMAEK